MRGKNPPAVQVGEIVLDVRNRRLGGYYIKFGQMVSTLDQGIPREWIDTLSICQVDSFVSSDS